jgi:acyl-[acyl-carrier-protein]-phospholipid O-acyltransferase/long-chain-fatty-acid--[acyl-carrier-protein] ligase
MLIVPLNAKIQYLSPNVHLGTILAGNNFIQTIFMFVFLMITTLFAYFGTNAEVLFYIMSFVGFYLSVMLFKRYFVMAFWSFLELLLKVRHSYSYEGLENIPNESGVILVGNHVSWIDWFIIQLPIERRINFMIGRDIYKWKFFNSIFKKGELIPLSPKASKDSFAEASNRVKNGKIIAIFPEGGISSDADVAKFYRGYEFIDRSGAVIVPFYIDGIFGSIFSRYKDKTKKSFLKKREITVRFGEPISWDIKVDKLRDVVINLKRI